MAVKFKSNKDIYRKYLEQVTVLYHSRQDMRMYTEMLLSLLAISVFGLFAIRPTVVTIIGLYSEIRAKRQTIVELDKKIDNLIAAQSALEQQRVQVSLLNQSVPDEPLVDKQIRQIEGLAKKNAVTLVGLNSENVAIIGQPQATKEDENKVPPPHPDAQYYPMTITIEGGYGSIISFLNDLELMRRPMYQESTIVFEGSNGSNNLRFTVSGLLPYLLKNE